jgi:hypothetical protein
MASITSPNDTRGPCRATPGGSALPRGALRWALLALACVLALGLVLDAGCTVRSRGQYDVSVGKTTRP